MSGDRSAETQKRGEVGSPLPSPIQPPSAALSISSSPLKVDVGPVWALGRLTKVEVENYRGVRGRIEISIPDGDNAIIYGENGSGKSSIFHAMRDFLESPERSRFDGNRMIVERLPIGKRSHRYTTEKPRVALHFGTTQFVWSDADKGPEQREARDLNKGKGFLDYPTLQSANHLPFEEEGQLDLFKLFIGRLLPYYTFPFRGQQEQFQPFWRELNATVGRRWHRNEEETFSEALTAFNDALEVTVNTLAQRANGLLTKFDSDFLTEFSFSKATFKRRPKRIVPPRVVATPSFRKLKIDDYSRFLNEARLSALATCLFLAALQESPASSLRILALDDILIGLDMSNRLIVLELIRQHFSQWQIFILTYSKAWFELLKERVNAPGWGANWRSFVIREEQQRDETSPRIVVDGSGDLMQMAEYHLIRKDYKAAAVYARSALESLCHHTCAQAGLSVLHVDDPRKRKVEHFLAALKRRLIDLIADARREKAFELMERLAEARRFVLNRNAHFDVEQEDTLAAEVQAALSAVGELRTFLNEQSWENSNFQTGRVVRHVELMKAHLAAARVLVAKQAYRQCQRAMQGAHESFWQVYGRKLGVSIAMGAKLTAGSIWRAAEGTLSASASSRLKAAKPYLFGSVRITEFDPAKCQEAADLLEELVLAAP